MDSPFKTHKSWGYPHFRKAKVPRNETSKISAWKQWGNTTPQKKTRCISISKLLIKQWISWAFSLNKPYVMMFPSFQLFTCFYRNGKLWRKRINLGISISPGSFFAFVDYMFQDTLRKFSHGTPSLQKHVKASEKMIWDPNFFRVISKL
jgi:hypothetical protein